MANLTHVFQISGIKIRENKRVLIRGVQQLGGKYIGGSVSRDPAKIHPKPDISTVPGYNDHPVPIEQSKRLTSS